MDLKDLLITPIVLLVIYLVAYGVRPFFTNAVTRRYFIPGLTAKVVGAIAVGVVYQFYYGGGKASGDTFNYFANAEIIVEAFSDSFSTGMEAVAGPG